MCLLFVWICRYVSLRSSQYDANFKYITHTHRTYVDIFFSIFHFVVYVVLSNCFFLFGYLIYYYTGLKWERCMEEEAKGRMRRVQFFGGSKNDCTLEIFLSRHTQIHNLHSVIQLTTVECQNVRENTHYDDFDDGRSLFITSNSISLPLFLTWITKCDLQEKLSICKSVYKWVVE